MDTISIALGAVIAITSFIYGISICFTSIYLGLSLISIGLMSVFLVFKLITINSKPHKDITDKIRKEEDKRLLGYCSLISSHALSHNLKNCVDNVCLNVNDIINEMSSIALEERSKRNPHFLNVYYDAQPSDYLVVWDLLEMVDQRFRTESL